MRFRRACRLGALLFALTLEACHSLADLDVTYKDCVDVKDQRYVEDFHGENLQALRDRCWKVDNEGNAPGGIDKKIFLEDGDLVIRVEDPPDGGAADLDQWTSTDQAPMVYRRLEGDFVVVARAEALSKVTADHCNLDGTSAGLVVRQSNDTLRWATWTVAPYLWPGAACEDDENDNNNPRATVEARSSDPASWPEFKVDNVGADGEADIAVCRVGAKLYYFYGQATSDPTKNTWLSGSPSEGSHPVGVGPLDVGVTASGQPGNFQVAGHINWMVFERGVYGDGCIGALDLIKLPLGD